MKMKISKMKFIKVHYLCKLIFVTCTVFILWNLYGTINRRMQNGYSVNHDIHVNTLSQSREYNRDVSSEKVTGGYKTETDSKSEQRRQFAGIQMNMDQIKAITEALPERGNLLVWGLGNDSPYWHNSTRGKVVFIEDDIPLRKAGVLWYDEIVNKYPFLEAYRVHYTTDTVRSFDKYINSSHIWSELDLSDLLPVSVTKTHWHVIIVDAPLGCCQMGPGRYQSIYTSGILATEGTHIFVDDFERKVEHEFSIKVFGKPVEVIKRRTTHASSGNEQAHFILSSNTQTRIKHGNDTKPDILSTPRNWNDNWAVLLTVNNGFFDFFENWRWHFRKLNIHVPITVIAEDSIVFERLISLKDSSIKVKRSEHISINKTVSYDSALYKKMVSARPTYILTIFGATTNIIYSDLDTVWLQNPLPYLEGNFDMWSQLDEKDYFCTGFLAIKSNNITLKFIQEWDDALRVTPSLNQPIFNSLVNKSSIKIKALDSKMFPSGKQYFEEFSKEERSEVVVVHNNYIIGHDKKVKRFQNMKLWFNGTIS